LDLPHALQSSESKKQKKKSGWRLRVNGAGRRGGRTQTVKTLLQTPREFFSCLKMALDPCQNQKKYKKNH